MKLSIVSLWLSASLVGATISSVHVTGAKEKSEAAILSAAGLTKGKTGSKAEFDEACSKLMATGFFSACHYTFKQAGSGLDVTLDVAEIAPAQTIRFDVPGEDESKIWAWMAANAPLLGKKAPDNEAATQQYATAL